MFHTVSSILVYRLYEWQLSLRRKRGLADPYLTRKLGNHTRDEAHRRFPIATIFRHHETTHLKPVGRMVTITEKVCS